MPTQTKPSPARPTKIVEPPLGLGRDIEVSVASAIDRMLRAAFLVLGLAIVFGLFGQYMLSDGEPRGGIVSLCAAFLGLVGLYMFALVARHRGRTDLVLRLDRETIDLPRLAFAGEMRFTERLRDIRQLALMTGRSGMWIELASVGSQKAIIPDRWVTDHESILSFYVRLELRVAMARKHAGKIPRVPLVGTEALVLLATPERPIVGAVVDKVKSKRPVVVGTVQSLEEYFERLPEWPESKLVVADDVRAQFLEGLAAFGEAASRGDRLA